MAIAGRVAIVPKGDWSADVTYKRLDAVTYNNTLYFAKKEVPAGTATSNTEYWSKSIVGGAGAIATTEDAGIVKPDGKSMSVDESGTLSINLDGTTITLDEAKNVIKLADTLKDAINGAFPAANVANNQITTVEGFALDARQANPNLDGTLAKQLSDLNGSLNNRLAVPRFTTTDTTTISDIKDYIFKNLNRGISYLQIYDEKCKLFETAGNWLIVVLSQDSTASAMFAVNHWDGTVKLIRTVWDNGSFKLYIQTITTTGTVVL